MFYNFYTKLNCYCVEADTLNDQDIKQLEIILDEIFIDKPTFKYQIGPKLNFNTPWCSNTLDILKKCNMQKIKKIEKTKLYKKKEKYDKLLEQEYDNITSFKSDIKPINTQIVDSIENYNKQEQLGFDDQDILFYNNLFKKLKRKPNNIEIYDLAQCNSEHSRHHLFNGKLIYNDKNYNLFELIKKPYNDFPNNSIIAFKDNASAIKGYNIQYFGSSQKIYNTMQKYYHIAFTAETHNFPTGIAPFPGATTGTGGRIRDTLAIGQGGNVIAGICGYCVGNIDNYFSDYTIPPKKILIEASDGASDYGNKFGEPVIGGFTRSFGMKINNQRYEWVKPIMFSGGISGIFNEHIHKKSPEKGMLVIRIGGPAYRIGLGGGSASSQSIIHHNAIQRGDPQMENKVNKVIRECIENNNIIQSIHDQGAGGMANVTKEIVSPLGADINLNKVTLGDTTLSPLEIWNAEFQESITLLIYPKDFNQLNTICKRENVYIDTIGAINNHNYIKVYYNNNLIVDLPLEEINIKKTYNLEKVEHTLLPLIIPKNNIITHLENIFNNISVSSKRFLTNKVDRSVSGLVAQQQCVGPFECPISNYSIVAQSMFDKTGAVVAIGEQPIKGFINIEKMARLSVGEMLTNIMFSGISNFEDIKCCGNWMWPAKLNGENYNLLSAVQALSSILCNLKIAIDGGKDSLSMYSKIKNDITKCPRSLVVTGYAPTPDINAKITPNFKGIGNCIYFINFGKCRMGASALAIFNKQIGDDCPDFEKPLQFKKIFNILQKKKILSAHDRSDGGIITTLTEMCISSNIGAKITLYINYNIIDYLFNEELGIVMESNDHFMEIMDFPCYKIGETTADKKLTISCNNIDVFDEPISNLNKIWEKKSLELEKNQTNYNCVHQMEKNINLMKEPSYNFVEEHTIIAPRSTKSFKPKVAIIREEGSNGEKEMAAAFYYVGFEVSDIHMNDNINLDNYQGIVFVGGFSYGDTLGAAQGWSNSILYNKTEQFNKFKNRKDTFVFGVCNGCQLLAKLGWVDCQIYQNTSKRFESHFSTVKINKSNAIMLKDMENTSFGIWIAHGEGKMHAQNNIINFTNPENKETESYPFNPNGSPDGNTACCSEDGRILAMMPHPERSILKWQIPWTSQKLDYFSPWIKMFENAYQWCKKVNC